jgi:Ser/Thr protein kinase RdoA (MazF antagonist)
MNQEFIQILLKRYALERLLEEPKKIEGGLLHIMWKICTQNGEYAVKILNKEIISKEGVGSEYIVSEEIADQAKMYGIRAVSALRSQSGNLIEKVQEEYVLLYPWLHGKTLKQEEITPRHAEMIGRITAELHNAPIKALGLKAPKHKYIEITQWVEILERLAGVCNEWKLDFVSLIPQILKVTPDIAQALEHNTVINVISHRDLDPKNVVWNVEKPFLIDWESAGYTTPGQELAALSLDWSSGNSEKLFIACLQGYCSLRPIMGEEILNGLFSALNNKLRWLEFNTRRALGVASQSNEEITLGNSECIKTIKDIKQCIANFELYKQWIMLAV